MKLKLLHKGLLLVSIPLCFELSIFTVLINLQDQVEQQAQRVHNHKKFNDGANRIMRDILAIAGAINDYSMYSCLTGNRLDGWIADIRRNFQEVKQSADRPSVLSAIEECESGIGLVRDQLAQAKQKMQNPNYDVSVIHDTKRIIQNQLDKTLRVALLRLAQRSLRITDDDETKTIRDRIEILLKCALGLSVLFAFIGATMYSKHLVGRLSLLGENARRLAQGEQLLSPVSGSDEIAELDRNFHYAAELIEAAKRMRQEVTAMISHDLKAPLQTVRSFLEMLEHGFFGTLDEPETRLLLTTQNACEHMVVLIDSVLQLEKLRTGNVQLQTVSVELAPLLDKCIAAIKLLTEEKGVILVEGYKQSSSASVEGDAFWLEQVFVNILSNAVKFTAKNSTVSVSTEKSEMHAVIRITDQGPGISKEDRSLIFDRFHRVQSTAGIAGTGLGLPIARELIELHHGSIAVESEVGRGSTFAISLPLSKQS
jgi:signal transduction histidine kinase